MTHHVPSIQLKSLAILLTLLAVSTCSTACSWIPKVETADRPVRLAVMPRDSIRSAAKGETIVLAPGEAFMGDSILVDTVRARTSPGKGAAVLHPIDRINFAWAEHDTVVMVAPRNGWILTELYRREVLRASISPQ